MRISALAIFMFSFALTALGQDDSSQLDVRKRLLRIELDSYFRAYSVACKDLRDLEKQIAQTINPESQSQLEIQRGGLQNHIASLACAADDKAKQIAALDAEGQDGEIARAKLRPNLYIRRWLKSTGRRLDVGIEGPGFFRAVDVAKGTMVYSRYGKLDIDENGILIIGDRSRGFRLFPTIRVPSDAESIEVSAKGSVDVRMPGETEFRNLGHLKIATFANPNQLMQVNEDCYVPTPQSGKAEIVTPGEGEAGRLVQASLEFSDSEQIRQLVDELLYMLDIRNRAVVDAEDY